MRDRLGTNPPAPVLVWAGALLVGYKAWYDIEYVFDIEVLQRLVAGAGLPLSTRSRYYICSYIVAAVLYNADKVGTD